MEAVWITLGALCVIAIVVFAIRYHLLEEAKTVAVWREFAKRHGHRWADPERKFWQRDLGRITGEHERVPFVLDRYRVSNGKSSTTYTRARAQLDKSRERVVASRNTWVGRMWTWLSGPRVAVGDRSFDERWLVRSKSVTAARELLDARARKAALAFAPLAKLDARDGELVLTWRGSERDAAVLTRALDLVAAIARPSAHG